MEYSRAIKTFVPVGIHNSQDRGYLWGVVLSKSAQEIKISNEKYTFGKESERTSKQYMRNLVPNDNCLDILDIGCGTGLNASFLSSKGHNVIGIDISSAAIQKFHESGHVGLVCDIAEGLPFNDNKFDLVYASEVIEHLADTDEFLAECNRVLKPNGIILLSTPNSSFWAFRIFALMGHTLTEVQHPGHIRFFSIRSLRRHLEINNFNKIDISARNMYFILNEGIGDLIPNLLKFIGFKREFRFKTKKYFWQLSFFSKKANSFFSDTIIILARKSDVKRYFK